MRHARQAPRPLPTFSRLWLESLENRLLLSGLSSATTLVLPEPGAETIAVLFQVDPHPRADQQHVAGPAALMQRSEDGAPQPLQDHYIAAGGSGASTAEPSTSPDDETPDDYDDYSTKADADGAQPEHYTTDDTGGEAPAAAVDYPSDLATEKTVPATSDAASAYRAEEADGMAGADKAYEDETTEEYEQYPAPAAAFVQPLATPARATVQEPSSSTAAAVDQVPSAGRSFQPSATTFVAKQASDRDSAGRLPRDSNSNDEEDLSDHPLAVPDPVAEQESLTDEVFQELAEVPDSLAAEVLFHPEVQPGNLLAGALPIDLATLQRAANKVLARLEALGKELAAPQTMTQTDWLVVALLAAGALELVRRRIRRPAESTWPDDDEFVSSLFPVLALPPETEL